MYLGLLGQYVALPNRGISLLLQEAGSAWWPYAPPWPLWPPCRPSSESSRRIKPSPTHHTNPRPTIPPSRSPLSFSSSSERVVAATLSIPRPPASPRRCNNSRSFAVFDYVLYAPLFELEGMTPPGSTSSTSFGRRL